MGNEEKSLFFDDRAMAFSILYRAKENIANTLLLLDQAGFDVGVAEKKLIKDQITVNDAQEFIQTASDKLSSALTKVEHLINKAATIIKTEETE